MSERTWNTLMAVVYSIALVVVLCTQAKASEAVNLELAFDASLLADEWLTADIKHGQYRETNRIMGSHPTDAKIALYGASAAILHGLVTYELVEHNAPKGILRAWEYATIGLEVSCVAHNYSIGLRAKF